MAGRRACRRCRPSRRPHDWAGRRAYDTDWQRRLFDAGYAGISWPTEYGGRGATLVEQLIYLEETTRAGAPYVGVNFVGMLHAGPTIMTEASAEQKAEHLPAHPAGRGGLVPGLQRAQRRLRPRARSSCRAVRDGDEYVITGQKIWTIVRPGRRLVRAAHPHRPRRPEAQGHHLGDVPDGHARASRSARSTPSPARPSSARCSSTRPGCRWPTGSALENDGWRVAMVTFGFERGTGVRVRPGRDRPADLRPGAAGPAGDPAARPPRGTTWPCAARSATSRPRWTRCGP